MTNRDNGHQNRARLRELQAENKELKELLEECLGILSAWSELDTGNGPWIERALKAIRK
jgi:hypothetical protein